MFWRSRSCVNATGIGGSIGYHNQWHELLCASITTLGAGTIVSKAPICWRCHSVAASNVDVAICTIVQAKRVA